MKGGKPRKKANLKKKEESPENDKLKKILSDLSDKEKEELKNILGDMDLFP